MCVCVCVCVCVCERWRGGGLTERERERQETVTTLYRLIDRWTDRQTVEQTNSRMTKWVVVPYNIRNGESSVQAGKVGE